MTFQDEEERKRKARDDAKRRVLSCQFEDEEEDDAHSHRRHYHLLPTRSGLHVEEEILPNPTDDLLSVPMIVNSLEARY